MDTSFAVDTLAVVLGIVELLTTDVVCLFVADDSLQEGSFIRVVECWWGEGEGKEKAEKHCDYAQHN